MPLIDMPLDELQQYKGRNPKPEDFDSFWDKSIAEAKHHDPQVVIEKADFETNYAICYDLWFSALDGSRIYSKLLVPKLADQSSKTRFPGIIQFHGYTCHSGTWSEKLGYVAQGYVVAAMDVRGQGGKSQDIGGTSGTTVNGHIVKGLDDTPDKLFYRNAFLDTAQLAWIVMSLDYVDEKHVAVMGYSQGGALALACASLVPEITQCVTVYPFLSDYQRVWEMDLAEGAYVGLKEYFRKFDPRHLREKEIFTKLGYIDIQHLTPRIKAKVCHAIGLMDTICPPSSQFAAINGITSEVESFVYPDFTHEGLHDFNDIAFQFITGDVE